MAILRAGPYASSTDSFLNAPASPDPNILPVNCGKVDWLGDTTKKFRHYIKKEGANFYDPDDDFLIENYEGGLPTDVSAVNGTSAQIIASWRYQATSNVPLRVTYFAYANSRPFEDGVGASIVIYINGNLEFDRGDSGVKDVARVEGVREVNLPASVVPSEIRIELNASTSGLPPESHCDVRLTVD